MVSWAVEANLPFFYCRAGGASCLSGARVEQQQVGVAVPVAGRKVQVELGREGGRHVCSRLGSS